MQPSLYRSVDAVFPGGVSSFSRKERKDGPLSHGLRQSHIIREKCFVTHKAFLHFKVICNRLFTCIRTSQRPFRDCFIFVLH